MCCRKLNSVFCDNPEEWDWVGDGRGIPERGDICIPMTDSCCCMAEVAQYCKAIIPQLILFFLFSLMRKQKPSSRILRQKSKVPCL